MSDRLFALRLFVRIARTGSFSKAGRELGLSQPSASRIAAQLEQEVGVALLIRTTRAVSLTEAGQDYLARIEPLLAGLEEAEHVVRGTGELRGLLRVALSSSLAVREVVPLLPAFLRQHPALRMELLMQDQRQDLLQEGADLALRFGSLPDSGAMARRVAMSPRMLVAAPAYLAQSGAIQNPAELEQHAIILGPAGGRAWEFRQGTRQVSVQVDGRLSISLNEAAMAAAVAGLGIVQTSRWGCRSELQQGTLVQVLADWDMGQVDLHAVFPVAYAVKPAARSFAAYLTQALAG